MLPTLHAQFGGVHVVLSLHAAMLVLGVGAGLAVALRRTAAPDTVLFVAPFVVAAGFLSATAWHRAVHAAPGLSSMGAIAGGLAAAMIGARLTGMRPLVLLDVLAPGVLLGFGIGRVGCFLAGCCFGRATELPWGVVLPAVDLVRRHPVQLYAAAADCLLAVWAAAEPSRTGRATWRALVGYGCARIVLETWRDPAGSDVVGPQAFAVARLGGVALVLLGLALRMRGIGRVDGALVQMGRDDSPCANG